MAYFFKIRSKFLWVFLLLGILLGGCGTYDKNPKLEPLLRVDRKPETIEEDRSSIKFTDPKTNLVGFKDAQGKIIISPQFKMAHNFNKFGIADVWLGGTYNDWYKINKSGKFIVKSYFFDNGPDYYIAGLSRFVEKGKVGYIDQKGAIIIPAQFDGAFPFEFNQPVAIVCQGCRPFPDNEGCGHSEIKGGRWGAINREGKIIIPLEFDGVTLRDNRILFIKGEKYYQAFTTPQNEYNLRKAYPAYK